MDCPPKNNGCCCGVDSDCTCILTKTAASSATASEASAETATNSKELPADGRGDDSYYFDSYAHYGIHEEMLKDRVRTLAYRDAILRNKHLFRDKVVLDVGCGTGILSMFAAKAGARLVIGVDYSDIISTAQMLVRDNNLQDRIVLLRGKMEEVVLPVASVDIIISEWMGYFLLYESMLDTVIYARDRYLVPGGLMLPDRASLHLAAIEDAEYKDEKINFWDNVYGFDFSRVKSIVLAEPLVDYVDQRCLVSTPETVLDIDLTTVTVAELAFSASFRLPATRNDYVHALVAWFDIGFSSSHRPISFSTAPTCQATHWKQTVLYLADELPVSSGDCIVGTIDCRPNAKNHRHLDIDLSWEHCDPEGNSKGTAGAVKQCFRMT